MVKLRGIEFGNVLGASGVQGFFGEGYWFHTFWKPFGLDFSGMTFVSKTATLEPRAGNMTLTKNLTPKHFFPDCIRAQPFRGAMLNAVGLSNPGLDALLETGEWQMRDKPFVLSIMSTENTPEKRREEFMRMIETLGIWKDFFMAPFCLQINLSCPNTAHDPREMIGEAAQVLDIAGALDVPLMPKFSIASAPISAIMELNDHQHCDAICVSNTLPFGWEGIDWEKIWGAKVSPLKKFGGGGLSGKPLRELTCRWIKNLRDAGFTKPINGGGGIFSTFDVHCYHGNGASSIFLGSVAALRPWRVWEIIDCANNLKWR